MKWVLFTSSGINPVFFFRSDFSTFWLNEPKRTEIWFEKSPEFVPFEVNLTNFGTKSDTPLFSSHNTHNLHNLLCGSTYRKSGKINVQKNLSISRYLVSLTSCSDCCPHTNQSHENMVTCNRCCSQNLSGMVGLAPKWVKLATNGTNPGLFQIWFQCIWRPCAKCTEIWSGKTPYLSHLRPIWPTLEPNLHSLR